MEVGFGGITLLATMVLFAAEPGTLLVLVALVALLFVLKSRLASPRRRHFALVVIGLGALAGVMAFIAYSARLEMVRDRETATELRPVATDRAAPRFVEAAPAPAARSSATETKRPKVSLITALGQAIEQAWMARALAPAAEATAESPRPAWVNAAAKMEDGGYILSVRAGPFTTPLECEQELPKVLQGAVREYAEISLGPEAAAVRLPDDVLLRLVRQRWTEVRPMEIGGGSQDMFSLHAQVVFDGDAQKRIKADAQRLAIARRVQGGAVVFGGVLGLMALAWGGLKWMTRRQVTSK